MFSTMKAVIGFVMLLLVSTRSTLADISKSCDMAPFYLELGCKPVQTANSSCPDSFNCPDLHPDPAMCYYRGVAYSDRTMIPQTLVKNPCSQACICQVSDEPSFECAAIDCVETFDADERQQCISTYEIDSCCSTGTVCGKDDIAKLKTCEISGKTYMEGETFEAPDSNKMCLCTSKWNGSMDSYAEHCRDINCGIEIHYQSNLLKKCAPVFIDKNKTGCPIAFQCPTNTSKIIRGLNVRSISAQCAFGNMTLAVGDEVTVEDNCTKCSCDMPPFVTCAKKMTCTKE